jgi:sugar phosphate isomerase/epimerase
MCASFASLCDLADARGMSCTVENAPYRALGTIAAIERLITEVGRGNAGICLNIPNYFACGGDVEGLTAIDPEHLRYAQLADGDITCKVLADPATRIPRLHYGAGTIDLRGTLAALPPDLAISPELVPAEVPADLDGAIAWARSVYLATDACLSDSEGAR